MNEVKDLLLKSIKSYPFQMKSVVSILFLCMALTARSAVDPYSSLSQSDQGLLKPQVERWIRDELKHNWSDLWEIQDQTPELKNELLLGRKDAPDLDRNHFVEGMQQTINIGYPEIKAFKLQEVKAEEGGYLVWGCGEQRRENWKQTSVTYVHIRVVNGKVMFGLHGGNPDTCKL
ncbi:MAG TPA: hypothetical protein VHZ52_00990 [Acidobacteriaceae bacterium]|jgi:hypothetical protein|nr:hypothetical protein [Acidobacteriaceae bacterium]